MNDLDWLQEVYKDYCSKHDLDHVSPCEQSGLTPEQWKWIDQFNNYWDKAQNNWDEAQANEAANVDGWLHNDYNELEEQ